MSARAPLVVIAALALVLGAHSTPLTHRRAGPEKGPAGEPALGVLLPFSLASAEPGLADLRDWAQDLLTARLTGEGGLRAGSLLRGELAGTAGWLRVEAVLVDVPTGAVRVRASVEGSADSLPYLMDRLAIGVLAGGVARDEAERGALSAASLPALRAYLAGREAARRGRTTVAMERFERALALDSTFVLAALGLAAIGDVIGARGHDEYWKFEAVWRGRDRLSPAHRALLLAHLGPSYPRFGSLMARILAGLEATRVAPDRFEGWYIAGENLWRFGSLVGFPDWEAAAVEAYRRALALDPSHAEALDRLIVIAAGAGDTAAVRAYAGRYAGPNPDAESADFVRWRVAVALDDHSALATLRPRFPELSTMSLQRILMWSHEHGVGIEDGDRAADILLHRSTEGWEGRHLALNRSVRLLLNRGRPDEAARVLADHEVGFGAQHGVGHQDFRIYAALYWDGRAADAATAAERLQAHLAGEPLQERDTPDPATAACALAHWRLAAGDPDGARAALVHARQAPTAPPPGSVPRSTPVCVAAADAMLAAATDEADAGAALEHLDALVRSAWSARDLVFTIGNLVAARLYEEAGDTARALEVIRRRAFWNAFLSTQLREEGRLAALAGDHPGAIRAYRHYLALRADPEPALEPEVERVRVALARIEPGMLEPPAAPAPR